MKKKSLGAAIVISIIMIAVVVVILTGVSTNNAPNPREIAYKQADAAKEADKQREYTEYLEKTLADDILDAYPALTSVEVTLTGILQESDEKEAIVCLEVQEEFTADDAAKVAQAVATAIGSETTECIRIQDMEGNVLFAGEEPEGSL